jgi:ribonucleoside-diphosphate reductase alpha chain
LLNKKNEDDLTEKFMKIKKRFTGNRENPFEMYSYTKRSSVLKNADGSAVFEMDDVEVPVAWSQIASDVLAQKYFRKAGVPLFDDEGKKILNDDKTQKTGSENSVKQVVHRLAGTWRHWGESHGYFDREEDAKNFYDEVAFMLLGQMCAPNSPQWFNTGLAWAYDIRGKGQGHYYVDPKSGKLTKSKDAYTRPQPHACFIQSVEDDMLGEGGIFDLSTREARIFKYGSGTGSNYSNLRGQGEKLSSGGVSSGMMSFLKIFDRAAGAIKSGGTTRRAAKMVVVDIDHPDVEEFITWKAREEEKVAALVSGSKINKTFLKSILEEAVSGGVDVSDNKRLEDIIQKALHRGVPLNYIDRTLALVRQGFTSLDFEEYDTHYESEAYNTVSGQNANNTVRVSNEFMRAVEQDETWHLRWRTDRNITREVRARALWDKLNLSSWKSADPGLQYDTTINEWHTCPESGRINASNPCSEYMFLDDTACNLASLNLMKFYDEETDTFLVDDFRHGVRLWTIVLEISVLMAQFPSKPVAQLSYEFRTLGLGYANIGSFLMVNGIPYDSKEALAITGAITAILTGESYRTSAEMAGELGTFAKYDENKEHMLRVISNHRRAAYNSEASEYEGLTIRPMGINPMFCPAYLLDVARTTWDEALELGREHGFRNAQVSVIAPTGTIGLVMDCDTTGIEPDFAIIKYKKLSGGGYFKIVNGSVRKALTKLAYTDMQIEAIEKYSKGHGTLVGCPNINKSTLKEKGFTDEKIEVIESQLSDVFDISFAFNKFSLGEEFLRTLNFSSEMISDTNLNILKEIGFSDSQIEEANDYICGTMTIEGAPHLKDYHLPIFDCANKCGKNGKRYITHMAHVKIMAAAQPFISGAISKTINMTGEATVTEIGEVHMKSWKYMLKAIALYRDGSKLSQPLNSSHYEGMDEIITLGDYEELDETRGPKEIHEHIGRRMATRTKLPPKRGGIIREASVSGHKVYLRTGEYDDGSLGEIFIDMYKEGAAFRGLLNSFAVLTSKALQHGIPLEELVDSFTFTRFEPAGMVAGHDVIKNSTSILDYVFRSLGYDYLNRQDFVHIKAIDETSDESDDNPNIADINSRIGTPLESENNRRGRHINKNEISVDSVEGQVLETFQPDERDIVDLKSGANIATKSRTKNETTSEIMTSLGYTGEQCSGCGSMRVKRNGSCTVCDDCGTTSGCS